MAEKPSCKFCNLNLPRVKCSDGIWRHSNAVPGLNLRCAEQVEPPK